ncbi:hypothetical protein CDV55_105026 [Aspergillus turcosus]|nr:hypothetical protein CDV55_105026 [Aspergillus turcosus]
MFEPDRYTVGWICALHEEHIAAVALLDEVHEDPDSVSPNDINNYTLGKVGKHYVVIVVLPDGKYGTCSAASATRDLLQNFPSIRIGLMVGVGGGAPSPNHDIRLGDIVVSKPGQGTGGVIQLDFGKAIQDQNFLPTGFLNQPPLFLLTAVNGLKTKYKIDGHQLKETIAGVLEKKPRLQKDYSRPNPDTDKLYRSSVVHPPGNGVTCVGVCDDSPSALVLRPQRTEHEDNPMIHYGLIASSNRLIKDAFIRDKLAAEKDVLCFEMEAAGLMDHFPCLVIRGICDYSDSHKNKEWQGYAAMAAAAYAKDLLSKIPPSRIEAQKKITDIIVGVQETVDGISKNIDNLLLAQDAQEARTVIAWLDATDYSSQQRDHLEKRQDGSCEWLLNSVEFQCWLDRPKQALFCPGIPGAGKTIASSIIVNYLGHKFQNDDTVGIAFIFYSYQQPHTQHTDLDHTTRGTRPSSEEVSNVLHTVISEYSRVFILIDALDECSVSEGTRSRIMTELFELQDRAHANLLVTSRNISEIAETFEKRESTILEIRARDEDVQRYIECRLTTFPAWVRETPGLVGEITTAITRATDGMFLLARYHLDTVCAQTDPAEIDEALESLPRGPDAYPKVYEQIMKRIQSQQKGFSRLALRVLSWITQCQRPIVISELRHALAVREKSSGFNPRRLKDMRLIVEVCAGLVTVDKENNIIRLVHYTAQEYFEQYWTLWFPDAHQYISCVSLTYLSYKQFSAKPAQSWEEYRQRLRDNCLYEYAAQYWGHHAREAYTQMKDLTASFLRSGPTLVGAAQALHVRRFPVGSFSMPEGITGLHIAAYFGINEEVVGFLRGKPCPSMADSSGQTALHWATRNGQQQTVELLLNEGLDVNAIDAELKTALHFAAGQDHKTLVQVLLKHGAQTEARDINGQTPLLVAAGNKRVDAVKELLSHGAMINVSDVMHRNALHLATMDSRIGGNSVSDMLLSHGIDLCACDVGNMTPLHYAVGTGNQDAIDLFLEAGANINLGIERKYWTISTECGRRVYSDGQVPSGAEHKVKDAVGLTPLHFAACIGHSAMAEYLLSKGADPNARCYKGDTPLHVAVRRSLLETRSSRQKRRIGFTLPNNDEWTDNRWHVEISADYISEYGSEEAQKIYRYIDEERLAVINTILAAPGLDVNIKNIERDSPLHVIKYDEYDSGAIVRKLLELGANIFACNERGQMPLHLACKAGAATIVCDFLDKGCCITTKDQQGLNALHYAVLADQYDTVAEILRRDERLAHCLCREVDARGRSLLHNYLHAGRSSIEMVTVLMRHGMRLNNIDQDGNSPLSLHLQAFNLADRTETCCFLLQHGADALWTNQEGQNLAHLAMCSPKADLAVLELLSAYGVDLAAKDNSGKSLLHHGAIHGSLTMEILNFIRPNDLLHPDDSDKEGKTPLLYASEAANKKQSYSFAGDR